MLIDSTATSITRAVRAAGRGAGTRAGSGDRCLLNISTRQSEWADVIATAERESDVWATVGIHPHEADEHADLGEAACWRRRITRVIGIGETGLDYFYDHSDRQVQQDLFRTHIRVGRKTGLPLIIHTRNAEEDTARILSEEMEQEAFPALIHCFTATAEFGRQVLDLGLTISISGIVTFKNARSCRSL
jgi:TatD DNase family protein